MYGNRARKRIDRFSAALVTNSGIDKKKLTQTRNIVNENRLACLFSIEKVILPKELRQMVPEWSKVDREVVAAAVTIRITTVTSTDTGVEMTTTSEIRTVSSKWSTTILADAVRSLFLVSFFHRYLAKESEMKYNLENAICNFKQAYESARFLKTSIPEKKRALDIFTQLVTFHPVFTFSEKVFDLVRSFANSRFVIFF